MRIRARLAEMAWKERWSVDTAWEAAHLQRASSASTTAEVCACWWIAVKLEEMVPCALSTLVWEADAACTERAVLRAERHVLEVLRFDVLRHRAPRHRRASELERRYVLCLVALGWHLSWEEVCPMIMAVRRVVCPLLQAAALHLCNRDLFGTVCHGLGV